MSGMETLHFAFDGGRALPAFAPALVGVVASGNLEVLVEPAARPGHLRDPGSDAMSAARPPQGARTAACSAEEF